MLNRADIEKLDDKAIQAKVSELRNNLFQFKMQKKTTGLDKSSELKSTKKDIARLLTAVNARRAQEQK